jgi:hypothetical protein
LILGMGERRKRQSKMFAKSMSDAIEGSIPNQANSADAKSRAADLHRYA